eukprot:1159488-Pelagomonas_calceolata.AAC.7
MQLSTEAARTCRLDGDGCWEGGARLDGRRAASIGCTALLLLLLRAGLAQVVSAQLQLDEKVLTWASKEEGALPAKFNAPGQSAHLGKQGRGGTAGKVQCTGTEAAAVQLQQQLHMRSLLLPNASTKNHTMSMA